MKKWNQHVATALALSSLSMACGTNGKETVLLRQAIAGPKDPAARVNEPAKLTERGERLVTLGGCNDCHTPLQMGPNGPERDVSRRLSGHPEELSMPPAPELPPGPWRVAMGATMTAWSGPWGVSFTANLTPDKETGIGAWTVQDFIATARSGRHMGKGRLLLPPMPAEVLGAFTDDELTAMYSYLSSLPPVKNKVHAPLPPKPTAPAVARKEAHQ